MHQITITGNLESFLHEVNIPDNINVETHKNTVFFSSEDREELENFKEHLISPIANAIKTHYKDELIKREFRDIEQVFTKSEMCGAADYVRNRTHTDSLIKDKLRSFFKDSDLLSIEGFINFRLTAFKEEITNLSADIAGRILFEKEYDGFFELLREYTTLREPLFDVLHIIVTNCGGYYILDENQRDITKECADSIAAYLMCSEICFDDIILYVLLFYAPKKTVIHGAEHIKCAYLAETVKEIFGEGAEFCSGCDICSPYLKHN